MSKFIKPAVLALALCLPALSHAGDNVAWGTAQTEGAPARVAVEGTPYYLDSAVANGDGDVASFKLYTSAGSNDPGTEHQIHCSTREFALKNNGEWTPPMKILAGESLYLVGKKLCGWDGKGLMEKLFY